MSTKYPGVQLREYHNADLSHFEKHLRIEDQKELVALFDEDYRYGLKESIENTDDLWVATMSGVPFMLFGITDSTGEKEAYKSGLVWAVATEKSKNYGRAICAISKKVIAKWLDDYDFLFNYIWEDALDHIKWLKMMGFELYVEDFHLSPAEEKFIFFGQLSPRHIEEE